MVFSGSTNSADFPVSASPYQPALNASVDGFLVKLDVGNLVTTGVPHYRESPVLNAFPNPFSDVIYVKHPGMIDIALYDALGKNLYGLVKTDDPSTLSTAGLAPGIYLLVVTDAAGRHVLKMSR